MKKKISTYQETAFGEFGLFVEFPHTPRRGVVMVWIGADVFEDENGGDAYPTFDLLEAVKRGIDMHVNSCGEVDRVVAGRVDKFCGEIKKYLARYKRITLHGPLTKKQEANNGN